MARTPLSIIEREEQQDLYRLDQFNHNPAAKKPEEGRVNIIRLSRTQGRLLRQMAKAHVPIS